MPAMSIIAHSYTFVVGVDTHARHHVYAIVSTTTGELIDTRDFPTTSAGTNRAQAWVARRIGAGPEPLWVIEGTGTYGAVLAGTLKSQGHEVLEAPRIDARNRHGIGKSDELDAQKIARAVLPLRPEQLRRPRLNEGVRAALRTLISARESMTGERTRAVNALTALLRFNDLGMDARRALRPGQITEVSHWRARDEQLALAVARAQAVRLAKRITELDKDIDQNRDAITDLVKISEAAPLLHITGIGAITAAICLTVWSHHGRVRSEAAYASLAGVSPVPASSGNTVRHRLNRGGDRTLNRALHMVAITRITHDGQTRKYVRKREAQGKTTKEIRRCIKRYLARRIYRILHTQTHAPAPA